MLPGTPTAYMLNSNNMELISPINEYNSANEATRVDNGTGTVLVHWYGTYKGTTQHTN